MNKASNANRAIKNTLALYFRMIFLVLISLYTVRVILNVLGAADYGIYNVVGGFVSLLSFITGTLTIAAQRYFATSLAHDNWHELNNLFSINLVIAVGFSILTIIITETIGLWFISTQLIIPSNRLEATIIVFELSVINFIINILIYPLMALLVADENLSIYAFISIIEGIFKLLVVYILIIFNYDKLILYATLLTIVTFIINIFYVIYIKYKYKQLKFIFYKQITTYKEILSFMNWNLIGALAVLLKGQGINIIMNLFFGPVINAARGIAFQINGVILSFSQNFMKAIDPQITKTYALGNQKDILNIIDTASKTSFYLLFLIAMPFMFNAEYILSIWLINVPNYTVIFAILTLIDSLINQITDSVGTTIQATGNVKLFQISTGTANLILNFPLAYLILKINNNPVLPLIICIVISVFVSALRIINLKRVYTLFSITRFSKNVLLPIFYISTIITLINAKFFTNANDFIELVLNISISTLITIICIYFLGLNKQEKAFINKIISKKFNSIRR